MKHSEQKLNMVDDEAAGCRHFVAPVTLSQDFLGTTSASTSFCECAIQHAVVTQVLAMPQFYR